MKKVAIIIMYICIILFVSSCQSKNYIYHSNWSYGVIDESDEICKKYYVKYFDTLYSNDSKFDIYMTETNQLIDTIKVDLNGYRAFAIYFDSLYYLNIKEKDGVVLYSYKKIGDHLSSIEDNMQSLSLNEFNNFIMIDRKLFYSNGYGNLVLVNYDYNQIGLYDLGFTSVYNSVLNPKNYLLEIIDNENVSLVSNDGKEKYTYKISDEVKNAKYNPHTNYYWYDILYFNEPKGIEKYSLYKPL